MDRFGSDAGLTGFHQESVRHDRDPETPGQTPHDRDLETNPEEW